MFNDLILLLVFNSLVCLGFYWATWFDNADDWEELPTLEERREIGRKLLERIKRREIGYMALYPVRFWAGTRLNVRFVKPICGCLTCMASVHSVYVYGTYAAFNGVDLTTDMIVYPAYVFALAGLNTLTSKL